MPYAPRGQSRGFAMKRAEMPLPDQIASDAALRLDVAAALAYPDGSMTASGLRREGAAPLGVAGGRARCTPWMRPPVNYGYRAAGCRTLFGTTRTIAAPAARS